MISPTIAIVAIFCSLLVLWRAVREDKKIPRSLLHKVWMCNYQMAAANGRYKARKFISVSRPTKPSPRLVNKYNVKPLLSFDITKVDPIDYKPYKTQGHVTMGKPPCRTSHIMRINDQPTNISAPAIQEFSSAHAMSGSGWTAATLHASRNAGR
jgi:hypothetical protein